MTHLLAIDPGTTKSGWCYLVDGEPMDYGWFDNEKIYTIIKSLACLTVIEKIAHMGMPVGADVFDTVHWTGRFHYLVTEVMQQDVGYITRRDVKLSLCGSARANDSTIRQALIDRFGGQTKAIGGKKCKTCKGKGWNGRGRPDCEDCSASGWESKPGILHGIANHVWSALAVGITYNDKLLINREL